MDKCEHCKHWYRLPAGAVAIVGEDRGECRGGPPIIFSSLEQGQLGLVQVIKTEYPKPGGQFDACALFEERDETDPPPPAG
jgi:hypothetical protein